MEYGRAGMPRSDLVTSLVLRLTDVRCFEDAGSAVLEAMLACAELALAAGPYASESRLLRGVIHLRPGDSYQRLFGVEHPGGAPIEGTGDLTSASLFRTIVEHGASISIGLERGTARLWLASASSPASPGSPQPWKKAAGLPGTATRDRMIARSATHVHAVPLRAPSGSIDGMISLEASCPAGIDDEVCWGDCQEALAVLAAIAAPYLCVLPSRPIAAPATDALLPVVGSSTASLHELLRVFARQQETILLSGPTGTGKSRIARWCHEQSSRRGQRFQTIHLLGVPEELHGAELFGWRRGAFTGASRDSTGAIARATGGTLFIDEIDKLSMKTQASLLHVLEERVYRPLGDDSSDQRANVRFIVGTNTDLLAAVRAGRFREDLYYRINVLPLRLPPLGERLDELPRWAEYMLKRRHEESDAGEAASVSPEAMKVLLLAPWPGNLRQLDNIVRRAYAFALVGRGGDADGPVTLLPHHVERALAHEGSPEAGSLVMHLWRATRAFLDEAERREASETKTQMSLDLCDAFRGMVLGAAVQRCGSREKAFLLLGQEALLKNRNHHRTLRRELDRLRELLATVGGEVDPGLSEMLDAPPESMSG